MEPINTQFNTARQIRMTEEETRTARARLSSFMAANPLPPSAKISAPKAVHAFSFGKMLTAVMIVAVAGAAIIGILSLNANQGDTLYPVRTFISGIFNQNTVPVQPTATPEVVPTKTDQEPTLPVTPTKDTTGGVVHTTPSDGTHNPTDPIKPPKDSGSGTVTLCDPKLATPDAPCR